MAKLPTLISRTEFKEKISHYLGLLGELGEIYLTVRGKIVARVTPVNKKNE